MLSCPFLQGDQVDEFQPLCEVQSDKATIEITSRFKGKVHQIHFGPGDIVKVVIRSILSKLLLEIMWINLMACCTILIVFCGDSCSINRLCNSLHWLNLFFCKLHNSMDSLQWAIQILVDFSTSSVCNFGYYSPLEYSYYI